MTSFKLELGSTTYECTSNHYDKAHNNWSIRAKFHDLTLTMDIPISSKVSIDKVMIFITALDKTLKTIQQEKKSELTFLTQLT